MHLVVFIAPTAVITLLIQGDGMGYLRRTLAPLIPLYAMVFLLAWACQGRHGERWRSFIEAVTREGPRSIPQVPKLSPPLAAAFRAAV